MKIGDLVIMPGAASSDNVVSEVQGVIIKLQPEVNLDRRNFRVLVHWFAENEASWEPVKWLEVVSESR